MSFDYRGAKDTAQIFHVLMEAWLLAAQAGRGTASFLERLPGVPDVSCDAEGIIAAFWRDGAGILADCHPPEETNLRLEHRLWAALHAGFQKADFEEFSAQLLLVKQGLSFLCTEDWEGFLGLSNLWPREEWLERYIWTEFVPRLPAHVRKTQGWDKLQTAAESVTLS